MIEHLGMPHKIKRFPYDVFLLRNEVISILGSF
jgi:hypothetical protein